MGRICTIPYPIIPCPMNKKQRKNQYIHPLRQHIHSCRLRTMRILADVYRSVRRAKIHNDVNLRIQYVIHRIDVIIVFMVQLNFVYPYGQLSLLKDPTSNGKDEQQQDRLHDAPSTLGHRFTDQVTRTDREAQCAANTIGQARSEQTGLGVRVSWSSPAQDAAEKESFEDGKDGISILLYPPVSVIVRCYVWSGMHDRINNTPAGVPEFTPQLPTLPSCTRTHTHPNSKIKTHIKMHGSKRSEPKKQIKTKC